MKDLEEEEQQDANGRKLQAIAHVQAQLDAVPKKGKSLKSNFAGLFSVLKEEEVRLGLRPAPKPRASKRAAARVKSAAAAAGGGGGRRRGGGGRQHRGGRRRYQGADPRRLLKKAVHRRQEDGRSLMHNPLYSQPCLFFSFHYL